MQACLDVVLPYVQTREQFGQPIGDFQVFLACVCVRHVFVCICSCACVCMYLCVLLRAKDVRVCEAVCVCVCMKMYVCASLGFGGFSVRLVNEEEFQCLCRVPFPTPTHDSSCKGRWQICTLP